MSSTHAPNGPQASPLNKGSDIKCVQSTKGWVCALCFPLGHPSRALERILNLAELKSHAAGTHYASLGEHQWENYVKHSVYYEAQFRGQSSLGLSGGVIHGPPTIASQKMIANKPGVLKRKYVKKAKPTAETAFDLTEPMINFDETDSKNMLTGFASSGGNQGEIGEMSDVESAPTTIQAYIGSFSNPATAQHQHSMHPMNTAHIAESSASLQTDNDTFYNQFVAQNQSSMHSMDVSQISTTETTPHTSYGSYCDTSTANYGMHQMGVSKMGASPINTLSSISSFNNPSTNRQFSMDSMDISQATPPPRKPSRKKATTPKNPLRQRLSENPSFESAVSVHGLARVQAAGNAGLQRFLDRQARGLPRTSNIPLPLTSSPPSNSTMGLPLSAANYAAAGMPNIHVEKAARRTKKVDHRRRVSTSVSNADSGEDINLTSTNPAPTNLSLNEYGVPAAIFGQAPGAIYESHTYKSIYAESTPPKEHLPLPEASFFDFSFSELSHSSTNNEAVQQDSYCQLGTTGMFDHDPNTEFTDSFVSGLLDETFGAYSGEHQNVTKHSGRDISRTLEPDKLLNDMGLDGISEVFDFNAFVAGPNYNSDGSSTIGNTILQKGTGDFNESFAIADIPKQSPDPQHNAAKFNDFFSATGIHKTHDSELDAMFGFGNPSSTDTTHDFRILHTTSLEYGSVGLEAEKAAQAAVSAGGSLSPPRSTASSLAIVDSSVCATWAPSPFIEGSSANDDAAQASEDLSSATSTPSSPAAAESAAPVQVPTIPTMLAPETAYMTTKQQNVLAAMTKRQEEQEAQHAAELEDRKAEVARSGADAEAMAPHKEDIQHQLQKQIEINEALTKQLAEQNALHNADILRVDADSKTLTHLNAESSAIIERQVSEIKRLSSQLAQQNTKTAVITTTKEPVTKQAVLSRKPCINTDKLLIAKKPLGPAEPPLAHFTIATAYHGRKVIGSTNNATSKTHQASASRQKATSPEPVLTPRKRATSPEEPSGDKKRHADDNSRFSSRNEPRKNIPDAKEGRLCVSDIEALAKGPQKVVKKTVERMPANSMGIKGPLRRPIPGLSAFSG